MSPQGLKTLGGGNFRGGTQGWKLSRGKGTSIFISFTICSFVWIQMRQLNELERFPLMKKWEIQVIAHSLFGIMLTRSSETIFNPICYTVNLVCSRCFQSIRLICISGLNPFLPTVAFSQPIFAHRSNICCPRDWAWTVGINGLRCDTVIVFIQWIYTRRNLYVRCFDFPQI